MLAERIRAEFAEGLRTTGESLRNANGVERFAPHPPSEKQRLALAYDGRELLFGGAAGGGKALSLDTPLPTPSGWTTMGDVEVGDLLYAPDGETCRVVAISSVMVDRDVYRVVFDDGAEIIADGDHLWLTKTLAERAASARRTTAYREQRKLTRAKRGTGKKPWVSSMNSARQHALLDPPNGRTRTTRELAATLEARGRTNHSVDQHAPLQAAKASLPLDPYVLGAWLGDGTSAGCGFTCADMGILDEIRARGVEVREWSARYAYGLVGVHAGLSWMGLIGNKRVPARYLRSSVEQRLDLLAGLMDTDGSITEAGKCEFTSTKKTLADGVAELVRSLGIKCGVSESDAKLRGRVVGRRWRVVFRTTLPVFRLARKAERLPKKLRATQAVRYVKRVDIVPSVPVRCVQVDREDGMYLAGREMVPTHNSDFLLMDPLQYVHLPNFRGLILRRTYKQLELDDSILNRAKKWWTQAKGIRYSEKHKRFTFPSGATITFGHMQHEKDMLDYQGAAWHWIGYDELTQFLKSMYTYLFSRQRRLAGETIPLKMRSATNPGGLGHEWVKARFVTPSEGLPATLKVWPTEGSRERAYLPSMLDDNPGLDRAEYIESLAELDPVTRAQLLNGDWEARGLGGMLRREWFKVVRLADVPKLKQQARFWDLGATTLEERSTADPTAGAKIGFRKGEWYITDMVREWLSPSATDDLIYKTAKADGKRVAIGMEQEPGASGKRTIDYFAREVLPGYNFRGVPSTGDKVFYARALSSAADNGNVYVVEADWNEELFEEADAFPTPGVHDDQVDAASKAMAMIEPKRRSSGNTPFNTGTKSSYWKAAP